LQATYDGRRAVGNGTYRIYGKDVDLWTPDPDLGHVRAVNVSNPEAEKYADLIGALSRASAERPAGRAKRVFQKLGSLAGQ
jgi:hypothetical protein